MGTMVSFIISYDIYKEYSKKQSNLRLRSNINNKSVREDIIEENCENNIRDQKKIIS
jgi:hypothetical protein